AQGNCCDGSHQPTMIKNERQYRITKAQAEKFERALAQTREHPSDLGSVDPILQEAMANALRSQLADLRQELEEYEALRSGQPHELSKRRRQLCHLFDSVVAKNLLMIDLHDPTRALPTTAPGSEECLPTGAGARISGGAPSRRRVARGRAERRGRSADCPGVP